MWDEFTPITEYSTDWKDAGTRTGVLQVVDTFFDWVNESIDGRYSTLDAQRARMLAESPNLNIKALDDGYAIETEKLLAIQQKSSRGFQIFDINPGFLTSLDYPLSLPYEFLFDGTNFIPDDKQSFVKNFRTINIPIAGNFCKVEYIYENNGINNVSSDLSILLPVVSNRLVPDAQLKYSQGLPTSYGEADLVTGQNVYSFDIFARNKVFVNFGDVSVKPHIIPTSGRTFKTYFDSINISLNIGAPKIRVTIGYNSEIYDSNSNSGSINQKMSLTGAARIFQDIDTTLMPFSLSDLDADPFASILGRQLNFGALVTTSYSLPLIYNYAYAQLNPTTIKSYGYSVIFISRIYVNFSHNNAAPTSSDSVRFDFCVRNPSGTTVLGITQIKSIHNFKFDLTRKTYYFEPEEPIRVVIPATNVLTLTISGTFSVTTQGHISYTIDGYSLGELININTNNINQFGGQVFTTKFLTDSTFIPDFNRIYALKGLNR